MPLLNIEDCESVREIIAVTYGECGRRPPLTQRQNVSFTLIEFKRGMEVRSRRDLNPGIELSPACREQQPREARMIGRTTLREHGGIVQNGWP